MIPVGYMYKIVSDKPDWIKTDQVTDIYSVSGCVSKDFEDWINYWKHNGYWFFDSPQIMGELSKENGISLEQMKLFFYSVYEYQWNDKTNAWEEIKPEESFVTNVVMPKKATLQGFDVTSYSAQNCAECSPLSCNRMAEELTVSSHCLLDSFEEAKKLVETGTFDACEPGPYRIFEVYGVENA